MFGRDSLPRARRSPPPAVDDDDVDDVDDETFNGELRLAYVPE